MNGVSSTDLALDMGFSLKRAVHLDESALQRIADCGGLTTSQLDELVSWTGRAIGEVRMVFRDEVFVSRSLRNPVIRGCPVCLRKDFEAAPDRPLTQMALRGDWQLKDVSLCIEHLHPLVRLWDVGRPVDRYDLTSRFTEIMEDIAESKLEQQRSKPSPYDSWLNTRLLNGTDDTWLKDHSLYASTTFCSLLGTELLRLQSSANANAIPRRRLAQSLGFNVARSGDIAIREALDRLANLADGYNDEPLKAFGQLYSDLARAHLTKKDFALFRKILSDCIVETWPIAKGESVLGFIQPKRRLHSVNSAAQEANIGPAAMEKILIHVGAISAQDKRQNSRKTFNAAPYEDILAEIPKLVGPTEMRMAMGATRRQFSSLAEDGVLRPRFSIPTMKSPWRISDGLALVEELKRLAKPIDAPDDRWEQIQQAKKRSGINVGSILSAVRLGKLNLARRLDQEGYKSFLVLKLEIDTMRVREKS